MPLNHEAILKSTPCINTPGLFNFLLYVQGKQLRSMSRQSVILTTLFLGRLNNQRTNGPVNAHLIFGPIKSTKQTKNGNKYEKDFITKS